MNGLWKIDELPQLVRTALQTVGCDAQQSGRVRGVPDRRTIRYYTTLGLLDKPVEMRGRTAFYGRRHVLQLVAIKKLQAHGLPLLKVQETLAGADERKLARWAGLPKGFWDTVPASAEPTPPSPDELLDPSDKEERRPRAKRAGTQFWAASPKVTPPAKQQSTEDSEPSDSLRTAVHLTVGLGITLVVEGADSRQVDKGTMAELTPAIEDLLAALRRAGLITTDLPQTQRKEPHPDHPTEKNEEPT
jgi:DNA-binding transcriptional MerR regulator